MKHLLIKMNQAVYAAGGVLPQAEPMNYRKQYRKILQPGDDECPQPSSAGAGETGTSEATQVLKSLGAAPGF